METVISNNGMYTFDTSKEFQVSGDSVSMMRTLIIPHGMVVEINGTYGRVFQRPCGPWTGEGLPPVGTVCAVLNSGLGNATWERCTILYSGKHRVMYDSESCEERVAFIEDLQFRPARPTRTPEQIAAEARDAAIKEMVYGACGCEPGDGTTTAAILCGLIYDAGYRKQAHQ